MADNKDERYAPLPEWFGHNLESLEIYLSILQPCEDIQKKYEELAKQIDLSNPEEREKLMDDYFDEFEVIFNDAYFDRLEKTLGELLPLINYQ